jgi:Kinetochore Sim4 complex subunit FTA2
VHCYGYIKLPVEFESMVARSKAARSIGGFCWDRPSRDELSQDGPSQPEPFRGIVKELVSGDTFTSGMAEKMSADLSKLSNIGVYPIDIKEDNYRGGRLTDFSASWTYPHVMLSFKGQTAFAIQLQKELLGKMIQGMIRNDNSSFTTDVLLKHRLIAFRSTFLDNRVSACRRKMMMIYRVATFLYHWTPFRPFPRAIPITHYNLCQLIDTISN